MKLFYSPGTCSLAPHITLNESGLEYEAIAVNLKTHQYAGGDYYRINPKGSVPALQLENGEILTEGAVLLQYIADRKPETALIPKPGTWERYRCQEWLNYVATELHKTTAPLWSTSTPDTYKTTVRETLMKKFTFISERLKPGGFLMGSQFTVADAYLFNILNWTKSLKIDLAAIPTLGSFIETVKNRPAVRKTFEQEGLR